MYLENGPKVKKGVYIDLASDFELHLHLDLCKCSLKLVQRFRKCVYIDLRSDFE